MSTSSPARKAALGENLCPLSLLIQIADAYGQRLRLLELRGLISVHFGGIRYLCSKCPRFEVLCVPGLFAVRDVYESDDIADDLDATVGCIILSKEDVTQAAPLMSGDERCAFVSAHGRARQWRTLLSSSSLVFPSLHTLEVGDYSDFTRRWDMPLLSDLNSSFGAEAEVDVRIDHRKVQTAAITRLGPRLRGWTVGLYGSEFVDPLAQLDLLPNLHYLGFVLRAEDAPEHPSHREPFAHANLREIDLVIDVPAESPWPWVAYFLRAIRVGGLPTLEQIGIVSVGLSDEWVQVPRSLRITANPSQGSGLDLCMLLEF